MMKDQNNTDSSLPQPLIARGVLPSTKAGLLNRSSGMVLGLLSDISIVSTHPP